MAFDIERLSLGWQTDLLFARFDGEVIERADGLVIRTPCNPTFWWGNFLLFDRPPTSGDLADWQRRFRAEIADTQPASKHMAFGIDSAQAIDLPPVFVDAGFTCYASNVLTMTRNRLCWPRRQPHEAAIDERFSIRPLSSPEETAEAVELQVTTDAGASGSEWDHRLFRQRQMARYRAMEQAGMGHWFGLFLREKDGDRDRHRLVASCGLFRDPSGTLGRFQLVQTHPSFRRQGFCTALVHAVCSHGFDAMGVDTLVIVADPDDVAIGLYESLGFERGAGFWQIERQPDAT